MRPIVRLLSIVIPLSFLSVFLAGPGMAARQRSHTATGRVLKEPTFASLAGSNQDSIRAVETDANGNLYVTGTTFSRFFTTANAAQPNLGDTRIARTLDLGNTWTPVHAPPSEILSLVPDPVSAQILYATTDAGIYKSQSAGETWDLIYPTRNGESLRSLVVDPGNPHRLAASLENGTIVVSSDFGANWSVACHDCGGPLLVDPGGSGTLGYKPNYVSLDWGQTFTRLVPPGTGTPFILAFDPFHSGWVYVDQSGGTRGDLWLTTDYGETWISKASPSSTFSAISSLQVDPEDPGVLWAAGLSNLYRSSDGGDSWEPLTQSGFRVNNFSGAFDIGRLYAVLPQDCSGGGILAQGSGFNIGSFQVAGLANGASQWSAAQLTRVEMVVAGAGCAAYITRTSTSDSYVAKFTPDGHLLWSTFLGGMDADSSTGLGIDDHGSVYVAGTTASPDFPVTLPHLGAPGQSSVFVTKLSDIGAIEFSVTLGGNGSNSTTAFTVDGRGNAYVAGTTIATGFPVTDGAFVETIQPPHDYTGFVLKLSALGSLEYATYLSSTQTYAGALLARPNEGLIIAGRGDVPGWPEDTSYPSPAFVMQLDTSGSSVSRVHYFGDTQAFPTGLAQDGKGNLFVLGNAGVLNLRSSPGAYVYPASPRCGDYYLGNTMPTYVAKLDAANWSPIYRAVLNAACGISPGEIEVKPDGTAAVALSASAGLPLHNPILATPFCGSVSSAVATLSPDGSQLEYSTYLDGCGPPSIAWTSDDSLVAGFALGYSGAGVRLLRLDPTKSPSISLDRVENTFSGDASAVAPDGLYSVTVAGLNAPFIDLGLNPKDDLPKQLAGIRVTFDGVEGSILRTNGDHLIIAAPSTLSGAGPGSRLGNADQGRNARTIMQAFSGDAATDPVGVAVVDSLPGVLTLKYPSPPENFAMGNVRNEDGSLNDADHPAKVGSEITLFVTGIGVTNPPVDAGSLADSLAIAPVQALYPSWSDDPFHPIPAVVESVPGFVAALFQVRFKVTESALRQASSDASGVPNARVGLYLDRPPLSSSKPPDSNSVTVYVQE